jgi:hypothetical protein
MHTPLRKICAKGPHDCHVDNPRSNVRRGHRASKESAHGQNVPNNEDKMILLAPSDLVKQIVFDNI